eukprot:TRINITY_DN20437_c0_g1_i1.p1 TRINITY_DN20437_c0_g1~~TRINITY_DN20437_c0_g1_i1.p1  ORF type:complete len:276 (+),score=120.94 TRINITY_DN20437_c0_g1_i1:100-927(+)
MCTLNSQWCYEFRRGLEHTCGWMRTQHDGCPLLYSTLERKAKDLFLSETEILKLYKVYVRHTHMADETFLSDDGLAYPAERVIMDEAIWKGDAARGTRILRMQQFLVMPWFRQNVFAPRLFDVFADHADGMTFDAFITLMSSVTHAASLSVKTKLACALFDFDGDGAISARDIQILLEVSTGVRNLWKDARRKADVHVPGPNVTHGWKSFPELHVAAVPLTQVEEGDRKTMCYEMSKIIFSAATPAEAAISERDFIKILADVPDAERYYSVKLEL